MIHLVLLEEIVAGVVVSALERSAASIFRAAQSARGKAKTDDLAAADFLAFDRSGDSLLVTASLPLSGKSREVLTERLKTPSISALTFQLCALRLTRANEFEVDRAREDLIDELAGPAVDANDAEAVAHAIDAAAAIKVGVLAERFPGTLERIQREARFQRISDVLDGIRRAANEGNYATKPSRSAVDEFLANYRTQLASAHWFISPPDFDRRRQVAIEDLYVRPHLREYTSSRSERVSLEQIRERFDRTVLLGSPGAGKSTAAQVIIYESARLSTAPIPFLVTLRDFAAGGLRKSVVDFIEERLKRFYQCPASPGVVSALLESGRASVIFDGLDELLETSLRRDVTDAVNAFCTMYPLCRVIITSRLVGYEQAPMDKRLFACYTIADFDAEQVAEYADKWFSQQRELGEDPAAVASAFVRESQAVPDIRSSPLLLALMCIIYRGERSLPRNRPAVYEKCATLLFDKWDSSRGIAVDLRAGAHIDSALKYLAYWMFTTAGGAGVPEDDLVLKVGEFLAERSTENEAEARLAAREFIEFCRGRAWVFTDVGSTADGERLYKFTHQTFLEYFAGYHLARTSDSPEKLASRIAPRIANREWDVVSQLAVQICDKHTDRGADRVFKALIGDRRPRRADRRHNILSFMARCLEFANVSPYVVRLLSAAILDQFYRALVEGPPHAVRTEGVENLLTCPEGPHLPVVASATVEWSRQAASSQDRSHAAQALVCILSILNGQDARHDRTEWRTVMSEVRDFGLDILIAEAKVDAFVGWVLVETGWISVEEYLDLQDRGISTLFEIASSSVLGVSYVPGADWLVYAASVGQDADLERQLASLWNWLEGRQPPFGQLPLAGGREIPFWPHMENSLRPEGDVGRLQLSPDAERALTILILALDEIGEVPIDALLARAPAIELGQRAATSRASHAPYIAREGDDPVLRPILTDWVAGRVLVLERPSGSGSATSR